MPHPYRLVPQSLGGGSPSARERLGGDSTCSPRKADAEKFVFVKKKNVTQENETLKMFMIFVILSNALALGVAEEWSDEWVGFLCEWVNNICGACYVFEAIYEIVFHRCAYFKTAWNIFNFGLAVLSGMELAALIWSTSELAHQMHKYRLLRTLRVLRIVRVVRALHSIPDLVMVVDGITRAMKSLCYVGILLFLLISIFSQSFSHRPSGNGNGTTPTSTMRSTSGLWDCL